MPTPEELITALGTSYPIWQIIRDFTLEKYPNALEEWNYPGKKYGWSFRIKDKKRAIIYLLPRDGFFKVALIFGRKATEQVLASPVSDDVKNELQNARVYAEGRGISVVISGEEKLTDVKRLIEIKLAN